MALAACVKGDAVPALRRWVGQAFRSSSRLLSALCLLAGLAGCGDQLPSSYVRVTVHLMHGDEPVTMDWVVECRHFKRGGFDTTAYTRRTVVPYVYGVTTRDGGMVIAVAPGYCASGKDPPPKDYLPVFLWGDKAGEFGFLTAYVTEAAFTNPASKLKVLDVKLSRSTREEREAWKKSGVKNVVPAHNNPFLRNAGQTTADLRVGCGGFERIPWRALRRV